MPILLQNVQGEIDKIVKVQTIALSLFVEEAVQNLVFQGCSLLGKFQELVWVPDKGLHITPAAFAPADMVDGLFDGKVPAGDAQVLENHAEYGLLVLLVQDHKGGGIADHVAVFFEKPHAEAMEGGNPSQVLIRELTADPLFHLGGGFVGKGHAENVGCGDAKLIHQVHIPGRKRFRFAGPGPRHHPDIALCRSSRFQLVRV